MKKTVLALSLCLMSVFTWANGRQVTTNLPTTTPTVTLTIDGQDRTVKPTKATVKEKDASHVECVVYAGEDKATVVVPVSFNQARDAAFLAASVAHNLGLITEAQWKACQQEYVRLGGTL